jgi:hypothetical protein
MRQVASIAVVAAVLSACGGGGSSGGSSSGGGGTPPAKMSADDAARLADQATFGPTPALITQISQQGASAWIDAQLQTAATGYPTAPGASALAHNPQYFIGPMIPVEANHDTGAKTLLNGTTLASGQTAELDLQQGLDNIFQHSNVGPFIGKQLIQFLVTSNPSPAYISRITAVFNNDGTGTRGNMAAVVKAILLDPEARGNLAASTSFGKAREPAVDVVAVLRALGGSTDGVYPIGAAASMGEPVFSPSTVFSFYPPAYPLPGNPSLVAPQFGILNTTTALARLNYLNALLFSLGGIPPQANVPGATGTQVDLTAYAANAAQPDALVAQFNANVLHHSMLSSETATISAAVGAVAASDAIDRARTAAYLVFASPRYQITR